MEKVTKNISSAKIEELKKECFELRMSFWLGKTNLNTALFKKNRKDIARIKTIQSAK